MRNYWKADFLDTLTDGAIAALVEAGNAMASPLSQIHIHHLGGAMARVAPQDSAFAHRGSPFLFNLVGMWADPVRDSPHMAWARSAFDSLVTWRSGAAYVNFLGDDGAARVAAAYGPNYHRLVELKRRYDPDNVFRLNQNINPEG
jgi:FAD/FMN-containing dehydrogenase